MALSLSISSETAVTVTTCAEFQFAVVNVKLVLSSVALPESVPAAAISITTFPLAGCESKTTDIVPVEASVIFKGEALGVKVNPAVSLS